MKILMVSDVYTHPGNMGNRQRIFRECRQMKELGWEIDFLLIGGELQADFAKMKSFFGESHFYHMLVPDLSYMYRMRDQFRKWLDKKNLSKYFVLPYSADEWYRDKIGQKVKELQSEIGYDAVWMQYLFYSKALDEIKNENLLKVIDTHDKWANRNKIFQKERERPEFYYTTVKNERRALSRADIVISIQEKEAEYFNKILRNTDTSVITIGDLVTKTSLPQCAMQSIGFIGALNKPNIMGINWFKDKVLPLLKKQKPELKIYIAGSICGHLADSEDYIKLGKVDELNSFYEKVQVIINPVQNGTGLNIKTIESLSFGKPLVTTSIGGKGLNSEKIFYLTADEPEEFADKLIDLIEHPAKCNKLSQNAHEFIDSYNSKNIEMLRRLEEAAHKGFPR